MLMGLDPTAISMACDHDFPPEVMLLNVSEDRS